MAAVISRAQAIDLDAADPLAPWRERFVTPEFTYLVGNSLGMAPRATRARLDALLDKEWAGALVASWEHWIDLPTRVGDRLAPVIGAAAGTVVVHDSTTVNLYQAVHAALGAVTHDRPTVIAVDTGDFPTDRYVVAGIAAATGSTVRRGCDDLAGVDVALRSLVDFRTGARIDLAAETARAAEHGTMVVWDLSHAAGAVEVDVTGAGVDIAVGCTYKYLHGGPGAPAFTYVRPDHHDTLTSPIWGWCAQRAQFAMGDTFDPQPDRRRFLLGTPDILGLTSAEVGIGITADAGIAAIAAKGRALTALALDLCDEHGLRSPTPRDATARGCHVAVAVDQQALDAVHQALSARHVVVDRRPPNLFRVGCSPLTTRFVDVFDGMSAIAEAVRDCRP